MCSPVGISLVTMCAMCGLFQVQRALLHWFGVWGPHAAARGIRSAPGEAFICRPLQR